MQGSSTLQELQSNQQQIQNSQLQIQQQQQQQHHQQQTSQFNNNPSTHDDFLDQMLSHIPSWPQLPTNPKSPYNPTNIHNLFKDPSNDPQHNPDNNPHYPYDDSALLASRLRQQQISCSSPPGIPTSQIISGAGGARSQPSLSGLLPFPLTLGGSTDPSDSRMQEVPNPFKPPNLNEEGPIQGLYNGLAGSLPRPAQASQQQFHHPQTGSISSSHPGSGGGGGGGGGGTPARPKVRARRGQATDPHSIAERLRRERIAERMKALQELVPNANKTDKASMLDEIIDYVKFLQLQVKVLSMSRLGGAAAVAPLVADISSEGGGDCIQASGIGRSSNGTQTASNDSITATEHQVAKMMEEDMGSAMQYLQGKGLCLMPISLATAISTATCHSRNLNPLMPPSNVADGPSSPSMSVLTVQSAIGNGGEPSVKDAASVSKP